jgi:hypothetical protein
MASTIWIDGKWMVDHNFQGATCIGDRRFDPAQEPLMDPRAMANRGVQTVEAFNMRRRRGSLEFVCFVPIAEMDLASVSDAQGTARCDTIGQSKVF